MNAESVKARLKNDTICYIKEFTLPIIKALEDNSIYDGNWNCKDSKWSCMMCLIKDK